MIRHEIERHLVQPQEMEIVLYLDPMKLFCISGRICSGFAVILPCNHYSLAWRKSTGR